MAQVSSAVAKDRIAQRYHVEQPERNRRGESNLPNAVPIRLRGRFCDGTGRTRGVGRHQTAGQARSAPGKRARKQEKQRRQLTDPVLAARQRQQDFLRCQAACHQGWLQGPSLGFTRRW